ncbi:MAG: PEP/pyruvate-binding domain-containing protein [Frankia sp.]|nr:PEP/pyruvate-binding domain-containing protein [Frankia sp.]
MGASPGRFVRWFDELRAADRPLVGGKCASLGELTAAGLAVPPGFAVTVEAFAAVGAAVGLTGPALPDHPPEVAAALLTAAELPAGLADEVVAAYAELCRLTGRAALDLPVAVRSSAVAEDGAAASFAGQQETWLWTVGPDEVLARLRDCWASLFTPQAVAYRARLPRERVADATRIAVGVQAMVTAEVAGVAFTVSPRTGDRSVVVVNASWGLGQAVVAGEVTPDEFWLSKADLAVTARRIATKARQCRPAPDGRGVVMVDVPAGRQDAPSLDDAQLRAVAELAMAAERHYGGAPQDVEWALGRGPDGASRLYLLQSRPETTWRERLAQVRQSRPANPAASYLALVHAAGARRPASPSADG